MRTIAAVVFKNLVKSKWVPEVKSSQVKSGLTIIYLLGETSCSFSHAFLGDCTFPSASKGLAHPCHMGAAVGWTASGDSTTSA